MRRVAALLLCLLPLSACGGSQEPAAAANDAPVPAASGAPSTPVLVLRGDGLTLVQGDEQTSLPFGSGTSVVAPALAAAFGAEPAQQTVECGQGGRTDLGVEGFDVLFDGEKFVGWDESGGDRTALGTDRGLTIGSTRQQVTAALPDAAFTTSTLGPEFSSPGGLGGFLDTSGAVVGLTGGETCVVR